MRRVSSAICTSVAPVSASLRPNWRTTSAFSSAVSVMSGPQGSSRAPARRRPGAGAAVPPVAQVPGPIRPMVGESRPHAVVASRAMSAAATTRRPGGEGFLERRFQLAARGTTARIEAARRRRDVPDDELHPLRQPGDPRRRPGCRSRPSPWPPRSRPRSPRRRWACSRTSRSRSRPASGSTPSSPSTSCSAAGCRGRSAMSVIVIEGVLALILVVAGLREAIMRAIPLSLKLSIGVGIGLFITLVGLREGGIVVNNPATGIGLGDLTQRPGADRARRASRVGERARRARRARRGDPRRARRDRARADLRRARGPRRRRRHARARRLLDDRRRAGARPTWRRAHRRADPGDLRPVHDGLLRHDRDGGGGRPRRRPDRRAGRAARTRSGCCWSTRARPRSAARWARRASRPTSRAARASPRARARASPRSSPPALFALAIFFVPIIALVGQGVPLGEDDGHPPGDRAGARDGRLPDDPDRRPTSTGRARSTRIPAFLDDRRHPAHLLDRRRHRPRRDRLCARHARAQPPRRGPPADVGHRAALRGFFAADWLEANVF